MNARVAFLCLALVAAAQAFAPTAPLALRSKSAAIATGLKRPVRTTAVAPKRGASSSSSLLPATTLTSFFERRASMPTEGQRSAAL